MAPTRFSILFACKLLGKSRGEGSHGPSWVPGPGRGCFAPRSQREMLGARGDVPAFVLCQRVSTQGKDAPYHSAACSRLESEEPHQSLHLGDSSGTGRKIPLCKLKEIPSFLPTAKLVVTPRPVVKCRGAAAHPSPTTPCISLPLPTTSGWGC